MLPSLRLRSGTGLGVAKWASMLNEALAYVPQIGAMVRPVSTLSHKLENRFPIRLSAVMPFASETPSILRLLLSMLAATVFWILKPNKPFFIAILT
ncbi:hypothetical protein BGP_1745 [Beggiatoa sp. PS]|nr:hypothetical protein BGP_1745 [Beggiatoa sp. PS]